MLNRFKGMVCFICVLSLCSYWARESSADVDLTLPFTILKYDGGNLTADSPTMFLPAKFDNEGDVTRFRSAQFQLSTVGMDSPATSDPATSKFWDGTSNPGLISILDNSTSTSLLTGELMTLSLSIVNPSLGLITGTGSFAVTGGSLASQFGGDGILETVALSFTVPTSFLGTSFNVISTSRLTASTGSGGSESLPEAPAFMVWLGLISVIGIGASLSFRKRRLAH